MKNMFLLLLLQVVATATLSAQTEKSLFPRSTQNSNLNTQNTTRALVIGISDYQDPYIPDLRYAHRDAEAFAAWLRSPAGGRVDSGHIQVLLNQKATMAGCLVALDRLVSESRAGDQVIIYFAGHSDVENKTRNQSGYLLFYDSPASVYKAGALPLLYLQDIITTLSVENKARVLLIADATHAGKLVGSSIGGPQLTAAALARQYANEVKTLSCQPNELSLEGEQWGGGRSAFSWRLLEGLYGLADQDETGQITAWEIAKYLEQTVPYDVAPAQQTPMIIGDRNSVFAQTDSTLSAVLLYRRRAEIPGV